MSNIRHSRHMPRDEQGRFIAANAGDEEVPPPPPTKTTTSFRSGTPYGSPNSPFDFLPADVELQTEGNLPGDSGSSNRQSEPSVPIPTPNPTPTLPTNDLIEQLIKAMAMMGQAALLANPPATPPPAPATPPTTISSTTQIRLPDAFDGSNPDDLHSFLLQCQLIFNSYWQQYTTDPAKVFFAISYLKKLVSR